MRSKDVKNHLILIFLSGFILGIIYINTIAREWVLSFEIFDPYIAEQNTDFRVNEYIYYISKIRLFPLILVMLGCFTKVKKIIAVIFCIWTSFIYGILITASVVKLGIGGLALCTLGLIPHFLCYGAVYTVILNYLYCYPESRWNMAKSIFVILMTGLGILLEVYTGTIITKMIYNML